MARHEIKGFLSWRKSVIAQLDVLSFDRAAAIQASVSGRLRPFGLVRRVIDAPIDVTLSLIHI